MKIILGIVFGFLTMAQAQVAKASGCQWEDYLVNGPLLEVKRVSGMFRCNRYRDEIDCIFEAAELPGIKMVNFRVSEQNLPSANMSIWVDVKVSEAMNGYACEEDLPPQNYRTNGTSYEFDFNETTYSAFVAM